MGNEILTAITEKEIKMLEMISNGNPYKVITVKLGLTRRQIDFRLDRLRDDFEAVNTLHLIAICIRNGII